MADIAWGIDLGTTNSCIARATAAGVDVIRIDESPTVPSVVAWDGSGFVVGRRAANLAVLAPDQAVRSIKRHMGESDYRVTLGGSQLSPIDVSANILAYLKAQAQLATGEAIEEVVITVPAWFNEPQRRATVMAGEQAGLRVARIINEPTAAGLAYGHATAGEAVEGPSPSPPPGATERWLVYDLGGGTFDVSILSVSGSYKEVLASCGNTYLGGDDFDHRIVLHWVDLLRDRHGVDVMQDRIALAQLRHLAEQTKIRLSSEVEVPVQALIESAGRQIELAETVSRPAFAAMIEDYVESTIAKVRQALEEARVDRGQLTRALLVGGSTRIPSVRARLAEELGMEPDAYVDVDLSVALGAGIQAALDRSLSAAQIVVDIAPHSLGVAAVGAEDEAHMLGRLEHGLEEDDDDEAEDPVAYPYTFVPIIRRSSRLPARFVEQFCTGYDGQDGAEIVVLQGESPNTRENTLIGAFHVPFAPRPAGSAVQVCFEYDRSGLVRVSVSEQGGTAALKSRTLDLGRSAESNSEAVSLTRVTHRADDGAESSELDATLDGSQQAGASSAAPVSNYLIEQVERQLAGRGPEEMVQARADLETYRALLAAGRDSEIDEVEERLYSWLDTVKAPGSARDPLD